MRSRPRRFGAPAPRRHSVPTGCPLRPSYAPVGGAAASTDRATMKGAMRKTLLAALIATAPAVLAASGTTSISGDYVEARTAEVFTGGCIMGSEGEAAGREAILAWRVGRGQVNGVALDGLSIVAVVAGDMNLGTHQLGGARPTQIRNAIRHD